MAKKHGKKGAAEDAELSKKDRKKLEKKAAKLAAEIDEREREALAKKAAKKAKRAAEDEASRMAADTRAQKGKKAKDAPEVETSVEDAFRAVTESTKKKIKPGVDTSVADRINAAADRVLADKGATPGAIEKAKAAKARAAELTEPNAAETDAQIKARLKAKAKAREDAEAAFEAVDRDDEDAVRAYNETHGKVIGKYATSTTESAETDAKLDRTEQRKAATADVVTEQETGKGRRFAVGIDPGAGSGVKVEEDENGIVTAEPVAASDAALKAIEERGFALPSDSRGTFETNGNGQYKVKRPSDGKLVGYTRVTTFIDAIDDKTQLVDWKLRTLLEGIATNEEAVGTGVESERFMSRVADQIHNRSVALKKARKKDRKGELAPGELGQLEAAARKTFRDAMAKIVDQALEVGGVHEKADKGTDIHALCQLYDQSGMDAVADLYRDGKISSADFADVEAYAAALKAAGITHVDSEVMVVNDEKKRAGRLDSIKMVRFPGMARALRVVADIKTGNVQYGTKIPMQLNEYANMQGYDPANPDERIDLKLNRMRAILIHLPQGTGTCFIYPVDLSTGRVGQKIAEDVRSFRTAGKKGIDFSVDLATGVALQAAEEA